MRTRIRPLHVAATAFVAIFLVTGAAFGAGLIALLHGAATVDWGPFAGAIRDGRVGPILLALGLAVYLAVMFAGIWISWRRSRTAFVQRTNQRT